MSANAIAIIPTRYGSTRFPGKAIAMLGGEPVIAHVWHRAVQALGADNVWIATDDERIALIAKSFTPNVVMTPSDCPCGTARCALALKEIGIEADIVVNVQGDEPFIHPEQIRQVIECFDCPGHVDIATLCHRFDPALGYETLADPGTPKVVRDLSNYAMYFSRSVIPAVAKTPHQLWPESTAYYTHIGLYAYRADVLLQLAEIPPTPCETAESLEQLRWLQAGYRILCPETPYTTIGIDTPADLEKAEQMYRSMQQTDSQPKQ